MMIAIVGYALFLIAGAFMGKRAGSKMSLYMGLGSGILVLAGYAVSLQNAVAGYTFLTAVSAALFVVFAVRLVKTRKFMPAGALFLVNGLFLALIVRTLLNL